MYSRARSGGLNGKGIREPTAQRGPKSKLGFCLCPSLLCDFKSSCPSPSILLPPGSPQWFSQGLPRVVHGPYVPRPHPTLAPGPGTVLSRGERPRGSFTPQLERSATHLPAFLPSRPCVSTRGQRAALGAHRPR